MPGFLHGELVEMDVDPGSGEAADPDVRQRQIKILLDRVIRYNLPLVPGTGPRSIRQAARRMTQRIILAVKSMRQPYLLFIKAPSFLCLHTLSSKTDSVFSLSKGFSHPFRKLNPQICHVSHVAALSNFCAIHNKDNLSYKTSIRNVILNQSPSACPIKTPEPALLSPLFD